MLNYINYFFFRYSKLITIGFFMLLIIVGNNSYIYSFCETVVSDEKPTDEKPTEETTVSKEVDPKTNDSDNRFKRFVIIGGILIGLIIAELIRRWWFGGGNGDIESPSTSNPTSSESSRTSTPEPRSTPIPPVPPYYAVAFKIYQYLEGTGNMVKPDVATDFEAIREISTKYGIDIFNLKAQEEIGFEVGKHMQRNGYTERDAIFTSHAYRACTEIWYKRVYDANYMALPLESFRQIVYERVTGEVGIYS
jgi:hypothetical protein